MENLFDQLSLKMEVRIITSEMWKCQVVLDHYKYYQYNLKKIIIMKSKHADKFHKMCMAKFVMHRLYEM